MKSRIVSMILAIALIIGMAVPALAAEANKLGSTDFESQLNATGTKVTKTVKDKKNTYEISGIYYSTISKDCFKLLNKERKEAGLKELVWVDELVQPAIQRALEQYLFYGYMPPLSHNRPDGSSWSTVSKYAKGENLAGGGGDFNASTVSEGWMNSPTHMANILTSAFTGGAVVCVETDRMIYWCELFTTAEPSSFTSNSSTDKDNTSTKKDSIDTAVNNQTSGSRTESTKAIITALDKAYNATAKSVSATVKNEDIISPATIKEMISWGIAKGKPTTLVASTSFSDSKKTQGQITLNPTDFKELDKDFMLSVYVEDSKVSSICDKMNKRYSNNLAIVKIEQTGVFVGSVKVAAKVDVSKLNTESLMLYAYDATENKLTEIKKPSCFIDENNYLHFNTNIGGYIIITDKALTRK